MRAPVLTPFLALALVLGATAATSSARPVRSAYVPAIEAPPLVDPAGRARCEFIPISTLADGTEVLRPANCWEV